MRELTEVISFTFLVLLLSSCTSVSVNGAEDPKGQMKSLTEEITVMTKNKTCKQTSDCRTAALGSKPCGGPRKYVVYSVNFVNETDLMVKASTYNTLDRQTNGESGAVGTCEVLMPPKLICQKAVCMQIAAPKSNSSRPQ